MEYIFKIHFILIISWICYEADTYNKCRELGIDRHEILEMNRFEQKRMTLEFREKLKMLEKKHIRGSKKYLNPECRKKRRLEGCKEQENCQHPQLVVSEYFLKNIEDKSANWYCQQCFSYLTGVTQMELYSNGQILEDKMLKYQFVRVNKQHYPIITILKCSLPNSRGIEYFTDAFQEGCVFWLKLTSKTFKYVSIVERLCDKNENNIAPVEGMKNEENQFFEANTAGNEEKGRIDIAKFTHIDNISIKVDSIDEKIYIPGKQNEPIVIKERAIDEIQQL